MFLSDASIRRPVGMSAVLLGIVVVGAFSYTKLGIDFLPKIDFPYVTVVTIYPGAGPKEVETLISQEIEDAVSSVDGIKHVRSTSMEGVSQVFIEFELGVDVDFAAIDVREKVDAIKADLPDDAEAPAILKFDVNAQPVAHLALFGQRPLNQLWDFADEQLKDQLSRLPGVASVEIVGGMKREIRISVDQVKLAACELSILDLAGRLARENLDLPSGHVTENQIEYSIRVDGEFDTVDEIRRLKLATSAGKLIYLSDVADVDDTFEEQRRQARFRAQECVGLTIKKRADANTVRVVDAVLRELGPLRERLPRGMELEVASEESGFVRASVEDVQDSMMIGIGLTAAILYLFLHNLRTTFIAAVAMPVSIIATFSLVHFAGFTLNIMSLMGMAICVGILVTNSIVVLENIERHLALGDSPSDAAARGTSEIALAVLGSTLTNVVVFLPIAFMSSLIGQFFRQFGLTVTFATLMSLFVSFTLAPMLASKLLRQDQPGSIQRSPIAFLFAAWDAAYAVFERGYVAVLGPALRHRWVVVFLGLAAFVASFALVPHIGSEFITEPDRAKLMIFVELPPGTPLNQTAAVVGEIEERLSGHGGMPEVRHIYSTLGKLEGLFGKSTEGVQVGEMLVVMTDKNRRTKTIRELAEEVRQRIAGIPGASVTVQQPSGIGGAEAPLQIEIAGEEFDRLEATADAVKTMVTQTAGTADPDWTWRTGKPEIAAFPDRQRISDCGISVAQVARALRTSVEGLVVSQYRVGSKEYDIRVKLRDVDRAVASRVPDLRIPLHNGQSVPLRSVARVEEQTGPTQIIRVDKRRVIVVSADTVGRSLGDVAGDMARQLEAKRAELFPTGYDYCFRGHVERMQESFEEILMAFVLAVVLTYLVLAGLLESFVQPLTIMLTLPLAFVGVFGSLYITDKTISIFSLMAVVMLVGIVVNNAILMIDYTTVLRREGKSREDALLTACPTRFRPIIMTSIAASLGMLPLALGLGWGAEMRAPMAIVSIGGLVVSTLLSLFVIPSVYTIFDDLGGLLRAK